MAMDTHCINHTDQHVCYFCHPESVLQYCPADPQQCPSA